MSTSVNQASENRAELARQALVRWVCRENISLQSVCEEHSLYKEMMDNLNPNAPSDFNFKTLQQDCLKVYDEELVIAKDILSSLDRRISISVDLPVAHTYHLCVTAHFVDDDWKLRKWVINYNGGQFCEIDEILKSLKEWNIDGKVHALTVAEDWSGMANAVREEIQETRELVMNGQLFNVQCSSDVISRMMQKGFKMIDAIIDKVKGLSWSNSAPLWYLTTHKLRTALEREARGDFLSGNFRMNCDVPSEEEWGKVRIVCRIADRVYEITRGLYEARRLTTNLFLPHLLEIRAYLAEESSSSDSFAREVAQNMTKIYTKYWNDMYLVLAIAAFMDPRYKLKLIEFSSLKLRCEEKAAIVLETIKHLYDGYAEQNDQMDYVMSDSSSEFDDEDADEDEQVREVDKQSYNIIDNLNLLREYCSKMQSINDQGRKSDLNMYLEEPVLPWTENFSVLSWWRDNCVKYPQLSKMARDFLAIPMSLANSIEAYYTVPREAEMSLTSLKPELMNALMCTRSWKLPYSPQ